MTRLDNISPVLTEYVEAARLLLNPVKTIHVNPGLSVPWDAPCGQLAGRVVSIRPKTNVGARGTSAPCGILEWHVDFAMSYLRCVAVVNDQGVAPNGSQMTVDGNAILEDAAVMQRVIISDHRTLSIGSWNALGADGGAAGGEWVWTARVPLLPSA